MKRFATIALSVLVLTVGAATSLAADSIGTIDYDRLIRSYAKAQNFSDEMKNKEADLERLRSDYIKQIRDTKNKSPNNPVAVDQLQKKLEDQLSAKLSEARSQQESQAKVIETEMTNAINASAKAKSLTVVLSKQAVFTGGTDITSDVLSRLNASSSAKSSSAK